jgi:hypothetical protein
MGGKMICLLVLFGKKIGKPSVQSGVFQIKSYERALRLSTSELRFESVQSGVFQKKEL